MKSDVLLKRAFSVVALLSCSYRQTMSSFVLWLITASLRKLNQNRRTVSFWWWIVLSEALRLRITSIAACLSGGFGLKDNTRSIGKQFVYVALILTNSLSGKVSKRHSVNSCNSKIHGQWMLQKFISNKLQRCDGSLIFRQAGCHSQVSLLRYSLVQLVDIAWTRF